MVRQIWFENKATSLKIEILLQILKAIKTRIGDVGNW